MYVHTYSVLTLQGKCAATGTDEDVDLGHCLHAVGITVHDTRDRFDRETFHPFGATHHITGPVPKGLPDWDRHPTRVVCNVYLSNGGL